MSWFMKRRNAIIKLHIGHFFHAICSSHNKILKVSLKFLAWLTREYEEKHAEAKTWNIHMFESMIFGTSRERWDMFLRSGNGGSLFWTRCCTRFFVRKSWSKSWSWNLHLKRNELSEKVHFSQKKKFRKKSLRKVHGWYGSVSPTWAPWKHLPTTHLVGPPMRRSPVFCISHLATLRDPRWFQKRQLLVD